jgi:hypothetical protein
MSPPAPAPFTGRYILVADQDPAVVAFITRDLRETDTGSFPRTTDNPPSNWLTACAGAIWLSATPGWRTACQGST